jgi:hypothetical protein
MGNFAQLLGMPPNSNDTYFVEVWVKPSDLFRPSVDNEINDTIAQASHQILIRPIKNGS